MSSHARAWTRSRRAGNVRRIALTLGIPNAYSTPVPELARLINSMTRRGT
jgi:hypothetical protein